MEILSLGEKIKRRRKELNMTLKDLAKDRITPGQISLVESGRSNPSVDLLEYLASTLNTTVEYLMESEKSQAEKISIYYEQVAESCILSGDYEEAQIHIKNALHYVQQFNLEYRKARIHYIIAESYLCKKDFLMAQKFFLSSNIIFIQNNNYEETIKTFLNLANVALQLKANNSALSYLKQGETVYCKNDIIDKFLIGEIYYNIARTYFYIENLDEALKYSYLAKDSLQEVYNDDDYAKNLFMLSESYMNKGDISNAIKYSKKTLEVYKKIQYNKNIVNIEHGLGRLFYELNDIEESFKHYNLSKKFKAEYNLDNITNILLDICNNYLKLKDVDKCNKLLKNIESDLDENDVEKIIKCQFIKHNMFKIEGRYEEAQELLIDTYLLAKNNKKLTQGAELAMIIGKQFSDNKDDVQAEYYLNEGVKLYAELNKNFI